MKRILAVLLAVMLSLATMMAAFSVQAPALAAADAGTVPEMPGKQELFDAAVQKNIDDCSITFAADTAGVIESELSPVISGEDALSALNDGCLEFTWQREPADGDENDWVDIPGATGTSYALAVEDVGCCVRVVAIGTGDYSGTVVSASVGPVKKLPYTGNAPETPVAASPTDLTITVKTDINQEYVIIPFGSDAEADAPTDAQWATAYAGSASGSGWRRFKGLRADTHYVVWSRVPGSATTEASVSVYSDFSTTANYIEGSKTNWLNSFSDIQQGQWYYSAVRFCCANKLLSGMSIGVYDPEGYTTRAMVAAVLWRMEDEPAYNKEIYIDAPLGNWYSDAVAWAVDKGIVDGYPEGLFRPNVPVTREQLAAMLGRYALYRGFDIGAYDDLTEFTDAASLKGYAVEHMKWAVGSKLIAGTGDGSLQPQGTVTRAQFAVILMRLLCDE